MKSGIRERNVVLVFAGAVVLLIALSSVLGTPSDDSDKTPSTYNSGSAGVKAAWLLLGELGFRSLRWEQPLSDLKTVDAANTTLVLAQSVSAPTRSYDAYRAQIDDFLKRGGRVLAIGYNATLLPGASTGRPTQMYQKLCLTTPEGRGALARAGEVSIADHVRWTAFPPAVHVEQWCGGDAVVVSFRHGKGSAVWWSSPLPLSNSGLKEDASLKLLLASVADPTDTRPRTILFDEFSHGVPLSLWDEARGLPIAQISWQVGLVALLLILSYSRRAGPIRLPARLPRTSPIEFAESMGQLYRKAGATDAATDAARTRLLRFLVERCGLSRNLLQTRHPEAGAIAEALQARFGGDWNPLQQHLEQAAEAEHSRLAPRNALALVKALDQDLRALADRVRQPAQP